MASKRDTASKVNASQDMKQYYSKYGGGGGDLRNSDLLSRIYDHGFSKMTMPSVDRPNKNPPGTKELSAKLFPIRKKHGKEPLLSLPQSTVFQSTQYQAEEMKPVIENNEDVYDEEQAQIGLPANESKPPQTMSNFFSSNRSQQNFFGVGSRMNPERVENTQYSSIGRTSSMPHFQAMPGSAGNSQHIKGMGATAKFGSTTNQNFFTSKAANQGHDRENIKTPFSEVEMRRTKYLVDKISGKFDIDKRYAATGNNFFGGGRQSENEKYDPEMGKTASNIQPVQQNANTSQMQQNNQGIEEAGQLRPTSKLDKYIDLILKNVTNVDEFIYLQRNPEDPDDPYNLNVINYSKIKDEAISEYYTISKKGLCHYLNGKPVEFIVLAYWLKERDTYDRIKRLKFFKKFRKWKTLKMWKKNVIKKKIKNCKDSLEEKLFILNDILRETLLAHRGECCDMEKLRFVEVSQAQYGILAEIPTLETFKAAQDRKRKQIRSKIEEISSNCRENIRKGFKKSLDELRKQQHAAAFEEDFAKRNDNQNFFRLKESAYENLGFPENMSYERRSELRKECSKFLRFSYLIDFLAMESLRNIYLLSVNELIHELDMMVNIKESVVMKDKSQRMVSRSREPLFNVNIEFHFDTIDEEHYKIVELKEFIPPPIGHSETQDFNIIYHVNLRKPKEISENDNSKRGKAGEESDDEEDREVINEDKVYDRIVVQNISKLWLNVKPNLEAFFSDIVRCIADGMNCIQAFERWSRHDEMTPYVSVLEEWDDMVGDDWELPDSNYLNPQDWLDQSPFEYFSGIIRKLLEKAFERAENFLSSFEPYLTIFWENLRINPDIFRNENLAHPAESLRNSLALLQYQKEFLDKEIPFQADLGLFRINSTELKSKLLPSPQDIIDKIKVFMPDLFRTRIAKIKEWIMKSTNSLKFVGANLEEFVNQQAALKEIEKTFPKIRLRIEVLSQFSMIMKENHFDLKKEDESALTDTMQWQNALLHAIQSAVESTEKHKESFKQKIEKTLIPELMKEVNTLDSLVQDPKFLTDETPMEVALAELSERESKCIELENNANNYKRYQVTMGMDANNFDELENVKNSLNLRSSMWRSLKTWNELKNNWTKGKFIEILTDEIKSKAESYSRVVSKCQRDLPPNPVLDKLRDTVVSFKDTMPVVIALKNPKLKEEHWKEIRNLLNNQEFEIDDKLTLQDLVDMNIHKKEKEIQEISLQATQEAVLEEQFAQQEVKWKSLEFKVAPYSKNENSSGPKDMFILIEVEEVFGFLDELLANLSNIKGSRYIKRMLQKAEELHKTVLQAQEIIDDWLICQRNWQYLENIFTSNIKKLLPEESASLDGFDKFFKTHMRNTNTSKFVWKNLGKDSTIFKKHKETLNNIQKALDTLLEGKRVLFPRFYFLSNDELLEILAKQSDLSAIQKHMKKCFDNIYKLYLGDDERSTTIYGMISAEEEKVELFKNVSTKAEIEGWLSNLEKGMRETVQRKMKLAKNDSDNKERYIWVMEEAHPAQAISTISHYNWCTVTEDVIASMVDNADSLTDWYTKNLYELSQLTALVRGVLTSLKRRVVTALITQDVHSRDIIEQLLNERVSNPTDFLWTQQLRYYWDEKIENILIRQVNAELVFGGEYMGATSRLVITPLTDRCWMTITGALNIKLGAAPAGPAGTGKTESTKDLAKAIGQFCVVFNCSDQIEYKMMERLFSGLAQQGAWACLDEFNRINIEVLSVIAQQLLIIRQALQKSDITAYKQALMKTDLPPFLFEYFGSQINLNPCVGVFITMNPGYAGRTELPDNLKVLFRPVSMMIPDYGLIAEIMLFSEGFEDAKPLSQKMVQLYKLSSEQLSQQRHYDFGMRAVKSVLVMAGTLKRSNTSMKENVVLIKAMRDSNIPKFLKEDIPLFQALIQDLFPEESIPESDYGDLEKAINTSYDTLKLQKVSNLTTKVIQLFETFNVRFGVMLVGTTGSAKTTCYQVLQNAMTSLFDSNHPDQRYQRVLTEIMNPKAISMGELYGEVNPSTKEWLDGLASEIMRKAASEEGNERRWIVFDGPVDALWIENMNTVLDDNMMLCLANGQRIKLRPQMRILFEVQDLAVASPATVSRCGIVYLTYEEISWRPYVKSWIEREFKDVDLITPDILKILWQLFDEHIDEFLNTIRANWQEPIPTVDLQLVISLCNLLECFLKKKINYKADDKIEVKKKYVLYNFAYCCIWSICATINESQHEFINEFLRKRFQTILIPNSENIFSFFLDYSGPEVSFKNWQEKVPEFDYVKGTPYFNLLVQTTDSVKFSTITENLIYNGKQVFMTGSTGTGKSVIIQALLNDMKEYGGVDPIYFIFSAQTSSMVTQSALESKLERHKKNLLGAKPGRKMTIFIDDINMPAVEEFGAQPPIELLRLLIDKGGLYDRKERFWKKIENTTVLACAAPPSGGRNELTPRFMRHFNLLCLPKPTQKTLFTIFEKILSGFLGTDFQDSIRKMSEFIVQATIDIYVKILKEKLPIPSKFHYTFNLRDVSKVFQGILMTKPKSIKDTEIMTRLWIHEVSRIFHDRLINNDDREWFNHTIIDLLGRHFKSRWVYEDVFGANTVIFGDLISNEKDYEEIKDMKKLTKDLDDKLENFNYEGTTTKMKLVFFSDAIFHIIRISRVLRQPRGNLMLIGVGGSGKQSLTKLSSYALKLKIVQLEITKNFGLNQFRDFIRTQIYITGVERKGICFVVTDTQIVFESMLEDINNLLNSGEVPNIFEQDKKEHQELREKIIKEIREQKTNEPQKKSNQPDVIYQTFVERVRDYFHIVLCMSPVGDTLRVRCRKFPSLIDCCTLDWFSSWPDTALISVSKKILADYNLPSEEMRTGIADMCKEIHLSIEHQAVKFESMLKRKVYNTPKSYLDLINLYMQTLDAKREVVSTNLQRLKSGITKLESSNRLVAELKVTLVELQPELEIQSKKVAEALVVLEKEVKLANEVKLNVSRDKEEASKKKEEIEIIAGEAQAEFDKVKPDLDKAEKAVQEIDRQSLITIRTYPSPPIIVQMVMEGVCILFGKKYDWATVKAMMLDLNQFVQSLINYPKDNIPEDRLNKLRKHAQNPEFNPDDIRNRASTAADLCQWCLSMLLYSRVSKEVAPKRKKVMELQIQLDEEAKNLAIKQEELDKVQANVEKLTTDSNIMVSKQKELATNIELTRARLERAEKLTTLLAEEGKRWIVSIKHLEVDLKNLAGDVFLSSACMSYTGPFTGQFRNELLNKWTEQVHERNIPTSEIFSIARTIGDPLVLRDWNANGLPSDQVSIENALFATKGSRWPLLIDPQLQANKWIRNAEKENGLKILKFSDNHYQINLKDAILSGYPALIQDVEETLEPVLDPILAKQIFDVDGRKLIRFVDSDIDYNPNFRLYITTKLPNPHYLPEIFIKVSVINFTVTFSGLEEQLLADVVKNERPEIEHKRDENIVNLARYTRKIAESESMILKLLNDSSSETLLDNQELINTLESSKITSEEVKIKMLESIELEKTIEETRNQYKDVSIRGSILYFVIKDLALIDPMYQYSLQYISRLFTTAMRNSEDSKDLKKRLSILIENVTRSIYTNVCRGLFEAHKLIFSFLIATSIKRQSGELKEGYWGLLLRGSPVYDKKSQPPNPDKNGISELAWDLAYYLDINFENFKGFSTNISQKLSSWKEFMTTPEPTEKGLPADWKDKLNLFEKILVLKVFRPEKLMFALSNYVLKIIGKFYLESPSVSMQSIFDDSDVKTPVIFVLSQGADPTQNLLNFAKDRGFEKLKTISLGQGQEKIAEDLINKGMNEGNWVLLQNCHLSKSFMPRLEVLVDGFASMEHLIKDEFRLFLTSMPESYFPVSILQNGIKLTTEPPRGIKANMKRSFNEITDEFLNSCNKGNMFHQMLFGLSFFHAIVQERRKFGPLGWNIRYEFNDSDLDTSKTVLLMLLNEQDQIPWDALLFVTGHINYGGRVTDDLDRRCLLAILKKFYIPQILEDKYQFSASSVYYIPSIGNADSYKEYINSLPISDDPECFGMHENANINFQAQESEKMISTILSIQPRIGSGGGGKSNDETALELARKILEEMPALLEREKGLKDLFVLNEMNLIPSLSTVLLQEVERFNLLLSKMTSSLKNLDKAIQGLSIMSQELDSMYYSLLNNQVPKNWEKVSYPSLKPLASWIRDLKEKVKFMEDWLVLGNPTCYWISGFYFPQGFMTGVLQTHARKYKIAIDKLKFAFRIMEGDKETIPVKALDGVFVYGLFLEGAAWDKKKKVLVDQAFNEMYSSMPVIYFNPTDKYEKKPHDYQCPVYKTSLRAGVLSTTGQSTNFILPIDLPTSNENTDIWTLRGAAMLTQLND